MNLNTMEPGHQFLDNEFRISREEAAAYRFVVDSKLDDQATPIEVIGEQPWLPPTAVAGKAMALAIAAIDLPAGAVHITQELQLNHLMMPDTPLRCTGRVIQNDTRQGTRFLALEFQVSENEVSMLTGRATIAISGRTSTE